MDYLLEHSINKGFNNSNNSQNQNNLNIYINNKEDFIKDKLISYLKEKRANKRVSKYLNFFNLSIIIFL